MFGYALDNGPQVTACPCINIRSCINGFADTAGQESEGRTAAFDGPARQLLMRDIEPVPVRQVLFEFSAAEEASMLHAELSAGLNLRTMMAMFGSLGQYSNCVRSDQFEPAWQALSGQTTIIGARNYFRTVCGTD
jgi:hypothetical protein